jgi:hypothetical protein
MFPSVFMKVLFMGTLLACVSGCGSYQKATSHSVPLLNSLADTFEAPLLTTEELAKLHDLPFPLKAQPTKLLLTDTQKVLAYRTDLSQQELSDFYHANMEYCGWEELGIVRAPESCFTFSKPSKLCTIVLRSEGTITSVTLFSTLKE